MSLGLSEIVLILIVVLILFGGKRIPELAKALGRAQYEYKKARDMLQNEAQELKKDIANAAEEEKKKLLNRLRRIEGQVRGLQAMVESNAYCNDILTQSAAVNAAVNAFNRELLAEHLRTCVARDLKDGHDEIVDELAATLQKLMK